MPRIIYKSFSGPDGKFATTNTTQGGALCLYPDTTPRIVRQQPPSEILPPGKFTTTNTQQGWQTQSPVVTPQPQRQQPPGDIMPPGAFTSVVVLNTKFGGETFAPATTPRIVREQPPSLIFPPSNYRSIASGSIAWLTSYPDRTVMPRRNTASDGLNEPLFPVKRAGVDTIFVNRVQGPGVDDRLRRHSEVVAAIFNSLLRQGILVQRGPQDYTLDLSKIK